MVAVGWVSKPAAWSKVLGAARCEHQPSLQGDPKGRGGAAAHPRVYSSGWEGAHPGSPPCPGFDHQPTLPLLPHRGVS